MTDSEVTIVRIYLNETDHGPHKNLMQEILGILRDQHGVHTVTVFRGIAGLGDAGEVRASDILTRMVDLPLVVEFYDDPAVVEAAVALLKDLIPKGRFISWRAGRQ
jgi:hypothetical protein